MLYNKQWDENRKDVHSLQGLISWLETKDATGTYDYSSPCGCLLAKYYTDMGYYNVQITPWMLYSGLEKYKDSHALPKYFDSIARNNRTFGDALKTARSYERHGVVRWLMDFFK
jgi:hypothetical protein